MPLAIFFGFPQILYILSHRLSLLISHRWPIFNKMAQLSKYVNKVLSAMVLLCAFYSFLQKS